MEGQKVPNPYEMDWGEVTEFKYATNFVTTCSNREIYVTFSCLRPGDKPRCISRIILSPEHVLELMAALKGTYDQLQNLRRGDQGGAEGFRK